MAFQLSDRVKESTTSTGTGNLTLAGAVAGFRTFSGSIGVNQRTYYAVVSASGTEWEIGIGYISNATTFVREQVTRSSAGGLTAVNFSAGTKNVFITLPSENTGNRALFGRVIDGTPESFTSVAAWGVNNTVNGAQSAVFGVSSSVNTDGTAMGVAAVAVGQGAVAVGRAAQANAQNDVAVGNGANTGSGNGSVAIGVSTAATSAGVSVGFSAAAGEDSVSVGKSASTLGSGSVAIGSTALAGFTFNSNPSVAIGSGANAPVAFGVAVGSQAQALSTYATALGTSAYASGSYSVAAGGNNTFASGSYAVALGHGLNADTADQFKVRLRQNPSPAPGPGTQLSLLYDGLNNELYAVTGGGGGGVTQIIAGPGISISPPTGVGIVTISAGGGGGFDWFQQDPSPVDGSIATPTIFTSSPSGPANLIVAGFTNVPFSPSGAPWSSSSAGGWFGQVYYLSGFGWSSLSSPYSYASGASQGVAFNYVQYPAGHSAFSAQNVWGSAFGWNSNFGGSFGTFYPSPPGTGKKLYGVIVISSGGTDLSGSVSINPTYPGTEFDAYYDSYSGATVVAFQNPDDTQVFDILNMGASFIGWGGGYSYYGHAWYEYT